MIPSKLKRGLRVASSRVGLCINPARRGDKDAGESAGMRLMGRPINCSLPMPSRTCFSATLYLLICASILSTYTLWDFMQSNSSKGTFESPSSYFSTNTRRHDRSRGLRGLFDLSNVNRDLKNLFEVEPAINDEVSVKKQVNEQENLVEIHQREVQENKNDIAFVPPAGRGPFSCSAKPICPELDIPGLVGKRKLDLKDIPMVKTEQYILGNLVEQVRNTTKRANDILRKKLVDPKTGNITHVDWPFERVIEPDAINISNYWHLPGGHWKPINCMPRWKVAVIIPFRDRFYHLPIILRYLVPMLQRQLLEFSFFIVEQANQELFNRAMLMNVGFLEALNFTDYDCFIIHDVDHVPIDDRNYYGCTSMPRHFVSGADRWNYKLPYESFFGAVTGLTKGNILAINGFPNVYWGWGGEDDEIWKRVKDSGLEVIRHKGPIAYYDVIRHHHKSAPQAKERHSLLKTFKARYKVDGLSDIVYPTPVYELHTLYTNISVDIRKIKPHYPMPGPHPANKNELAKKIAALSMKGKAAMKKAGPGVHKPAGPQSAEAAKKNPLPNGETGKEETKDGGKVGEEHGGEKPKEGGDNKEEKKTAVEGENKENKGEHKENEGEEDGNGGETKGREGGIKSDGEGNKGKQGEKEIEGGKKENE